MTDLQSDGKSVKPNEGAILMKSCMALVDNLFRICQARSVSTRMDCVQIVGRIGTIALTPCSEISSSRMSPAKKGFILEYVSRTALRIHLGKFGVLFHQYNHHCVNHLTNLIHCGHKWGVRRC